jgi:arsenite methyltransferase
MTERHTVDPWAEWLLRGRDAPLTEQQRRDQTDGLHRLRDRVLDSAHLAEGHRVLDIGAGTGLLALGAAGAVTTGGAVIALDISHDALLHCRNDATSRPLAPVVRCVVADAMRLPFPDDSFDAIVMRSALIYMWDKQRAINEMRRVLRRGGRVSLFEPINAAARLTSLEDDEVPEAIRERHRHVRETFRARSVHWEPMMNFDERDLVRWFADAGFEAVGLDYELLVTRLPTSTDQAEQLLDRRGNPTAPTLREAAVEALGDHAADSYLRALVAANASRPRATVYAHAYLTATRHDH